MGGCGQGLKPQAGCEGFWEAGRSLGSSPKRSGGGRGEACPPCPPSGSWAAHCPSLHGLSPVSGQTAGVKFGFCSAPQRDESKHRDCVTADTQTHLPPTPPPAVSGASSLRLHRPAPAPWPSSCCLAYPPCPFLLLSHQPFLRAPNTWPSLL